MRLWAPTDAPALAAAVTASVEHLRPWMPWIAEEPLSLDDRAALIARFRTEWEAGGDAVYGAFHEGVVVGGTGLHRRRGPGVLEIGYWVHVDHVGRGYATEMAGALVDTAFAVPGIERVEIHHDRANAASRRVPERLGFTFVGEEPDEITAPGEVGIDCAWALARPASPVSPEAAAGGASSAEPARAAATGGARPGSSSSTARAEGDWHDGRPGRTRGMPDDLEEPQDHELEEPVDPSPDQQSALMDAIENERDEGSAAAGG